MALIEVKDLAKIYSNEGLETIALNKASFTINEGEFVAIMGPSGSGKSTLLHILGLLDKQTKGDYKFNGKSIENYSTEELAHIRSQQMGFVFQSFSLLPRTSVLDNVRLPLIYSGKPENSWNKIALDAIESVGLSHRMNNAPSQLSGGEQQRAAIARALVNNPRVIFADEPTGNLDSKSGKMIMEILQELNEKKKHTIILITHETFTAEHAQRIIHVYDGEIVSDEKVKTRRKANEEFTK